MRSRDRRLPPGLVFRTRLRRRLAVAAVALAGATALTGCGGRSDQPARPLLVFGHTGMGPGEFSYPRAAVATPDGRFYVVDKAARIQCFDPAGKYLLEWQMPEQAAGKPTGLGLGPDGTVYVADTHYARVMIFDPDGKPLGSFGSFGEGPGQFHLPTDVAVDHDGFIYVSEYSGNDRINKFSPSREYLFSFGGRDAGEGRLERPQSLLLGPDGTLWVTDACNHRICRFDSEGHFLGAFGHAGRGLGELRFPYGLDMLSDGTLVVTEYGNYRLQRFKQDGTSLGIWGMVGRQPGELAYPWAAVVGKNDQIIIVDSGNNRIQIIDGLPRGTWRTQIAETAAAIP